MRTIRIATLIAAVAVAVVNLIPPCARAEEMSKKERMALFRRGAELWPTYCGQCHMARPGSEFSPAQWDVIMMHMRTRANLSGENTRALVEFLRSR